MSSFLKKEKNNYDQIRKDLGHTIKSSPCDHVDCSDILHPQSSGIAYQSLCKLRM